MRNTGDVTGKPIAVLWQSISGVSAVNPLVAFYDIHGEKISHVEEDRHLPRVVSVTK
jgi:hypothetical protein